METFSAEPVRGHVVLSPFAQNVPFTQAGKEIVPASRGLSSLPVRPGLPLAVAAVHVLARLVFFLASNLKSKNIYVYKNLEIISNIEEQDKKGDFSGKGNLRKETHARKFEHVALPYTENRINTQQ